ncbi:MAG: choice-of-anchor B family protein, partial [Phycisphaerales bacterium]|nr:choice-of-anchor B family protein [Phycisphaerales bacterium]
MKRNTIITAALLGVIAPAAILIAHQDDPKIKDRQPAVKANAFRADRSSGQERSLGFASENVQLKSWLPLNELDSADSGNDCWGYVSPSGREYALMGTSSGTVIVEVTNPGNAQVVASLSGPNSLWRDIKTYSTYMYVVSEGGGGIQVFNLADIDNGNVQTLNSAGSGATHNVVIDTESGFLYRTGGAPDGMYIYSLANPAAPVQVGQWTDRYIHDAQVVTYTQGPFAGRQIAFCCAGFSGGWSDTGLTIVDVTNKSNTFVVSQAYYSNAAYSHQGWLSEDRKYFYLNDELDEQNFGGNTTTRVINVEDIENPSFIGTFTSG